MKDTNKFVNNKDFGKIAQSASSSRGSNTPTQVGNDNQRERYNQDRDKNTKIQVANRAYGNAPGTSAADKKAYGKDMGRASASGRGGKLTAADVKASEKKYKYSEATGARKSQRAGGSGK